MKKKIFIFNSKSKAALYGVGTYMTQLTYCLKEANAEFAVIYLNSVEKEVTIDEKDGYRQISIPTVRRYDNMAMQYYSRNVAYLLREFIPVDTKYQYIFHLNFMSDTYLVLKLKEMFKCKVILTVHYTDWSFSLLGDYSHLRKMLSKEYTQLDYFEKGIAQSFKKDEKMLSLCDKSVYIAQHSQKSILENTKINKDCTVVINNGLQDVFQDKDMSKISEIKKKHKINNETKIVIFAGRLDAVKGVLFLIESFKIVLDQHPDAMLIIAGDGDFRQLYQASNSYWSKIVFSGKLEREQLYELYQIADVGVVCSLHEEFGYVAIEMMMHQLPVVVTNVGGLSEIVKDGVSGLKVPVRKRQGKRVINTKELAGKIIALLDDPSLARCIGIGGRERYKKMYDLSVFKKNILDLYENA